MKYISVIPRAIWKTLFVVNFSIGLIILYPLFYLFLIHEKGFPLAFRLKKLYARWIITVPGLFLKIKWKTNKKKLPRPSVYCSNHVSYLDIVCSYLVIPDYYISMGKQELLKVPLFNIFFKKMNIPVDRKSNVGAHKAFLRAATEIEKGHSIFLFPEGTISSDGRLRGFKNGAFRLAIEKQVPVVPITFLNNWKMLQNGGFFKALGKPGLCKVVVHEPISTVGMTENDLVSLRTKVHDIIQNELNRYNNSIPS